MKIVTCEYCQSHNYLTTHSNSKVYNCDSCGAPLKLQTFSKVKVMHGGKENVRLTRIYTKMPTNPQYGDILITEW